MELVLERRYLKPSYTIGCLSVCGTRFCDTLEDRVRDLKQEPKVPGATAIPGWPLRSDRQPFAAFGRDLPRLLDVPGFEGILIHRGNTAKDTAGCILVGENRLPGQVLNSTPYELRLTSLIREAQEKGEKIHITITDP